MVLVEAHLDMSHVQEYAQSFTNFVVWCGRGVKSFFVDTLAPRIDKLWLEVIKPALADASNFFKTTPYVGNGALFGLGLTITFSRDEVYVKAIGVLLTVFSAYQLYMEFTLANVRT